MKYKASSLIKFTAVGLFVSLLSLAPATGHAGQLPAGSIRFTGQVVFDTNSPAKATQVTEWISPVVNTENGVFASEGFAVTNGDSAYFTIALLASGSVPNFINVDGYEMDLGSSSITTQGSFPGLGGYVTTQGHGLLSGNGFSPTDCSYSFSTQDPAVQFNPTAYTFSASINVIPEPSTLALSALGGLGSLGSLVLFRRRNN